jgi:hypothetical protein
MTEAAQIVLILGWPAMLAGLGLAIAALLSGDNEDIHPR